MMRGGFVSLVGAGPGDPGLLTCQAARRLAEADLILYDALVSREVVALGAQAQRFCVGKRAGRQAVRQETINRLLIRAARRGKRVVRLKCGDPFVLGRGGEEALALDAAGVPFEVIPGLTAAMAAPALAGIPVTHRGLASGFVVVTGHAATVYGPIVDAIAPHSLTVIVLMGLRSRRDLASRLIARGWRPTTPAAIMLDASTPRSLTWRGTIAGLAGAPVDTPRHAAGTIVIGGVVSLGSMMIARESHESAWPVLAIPGR